MDDGERLESIIGLIAEINELHGTHVLLVEGLKDVAALEASGVSGDFFCVQSGGGPVKAAEHVWRSGTKAVILTDWDRRGDNLARTLADNLSALGVGFDEGIRRRMAIACRPYCKDVESLDTVIDTLMSHTGAENRDLLGRGHAEAMSGVFIVIEGVDGSGKSTVCAKVADVLRGRGMDVELTAEPTHEGVGAFIRSGAAGHISQRTEALLFVADRNDHTERIVASVGSGSVVICDRYFASTVAYQSAKLDGDSTDRDWLLQINSDFISKPAVTVLLDMDPAKSLERVASRGEEVSKFESLGFLRQVRDAYLELAERFGFRIVDASASPDKVFADVMRIIDEVV